MKSVTIFTTIILGALYLESCIPFREYLPEWEADTTPPVLERYFTLDKQRVQLCFDEEIKLNASDFAGTRSIRNVEIEKDNVIVEFTDLSDPGAPYTLTGIIEDLRGNTLSFLLEFFGINEKLPQTLITEISPRGSKTKPDFIELYFITDGNTAGLTIYIGTPKHSDFEYILPSINVKAGDFLLLHFKGESGSINETESKTQSTQELSNNNAWDLWSQTSDHLPGNNGIVSIATHPGGKIIDALIYSNRTSLSDSKYQGFGSSRLLTTASDLHTENEWFNLAETNELSPDFAIWSDYTTSTRTLCRNISMIDGNNKEDWYTAISRGSTPGSLNIEEEYTP